MLAVDQPFELAEMLAQRLEALPESGEVPLPAQSCTCNSVARSGHDALRNPIGAQGRNGRSFHAPGMEPPRPGGPTSG
ncbi:hypothetical protein LNKW23_32480 [Paralimibaculum aggregatum]|uniref:Uncharacterized protein n=1 Tax=Paralimibaculum aggregatum TaxID=3036245 RepID=A0ABQ6LLF7_9RHOB|nr:hypothetical protein LNKW23_32480 [Limibaculum sp. NKW23]